MGAPQRPNPSPQSELEALLVRMRRRAYPETLPVLGSYWLKTVFGLGQKRQWWKELNQRLTKALGDVAPDTPSYQVLSSVRAWIAHSGLLTGKLTTAPSPKGESFRANLDPERLRPYLGRLLNEWLPPEVAYLLVTESHEDEPANGIPVLAMAKALERILVRERLSPGTLEMLLAAELQSPRYFYPAHIEILHDVILALLGRTTAPVPPILPATLLGVAAHTALPRNYEEAVRCASTVRSGDVEQIQVPIAAAQATEILHGDPVHLASILVTTDGRWWEADSLQSGERHAVIYTPRGRLRIDDSADHARLDVPWPETQLRWSGASPFRQPLELFGREWHVASWETGGERAWLHLVFSRVLPVAAAHAAEDRYPRLRPAFVDMAWSAMESALAASLRHKNREPIEQLRRADLVPLGRALFGLAESATSRRLANRETLDTQLRGIRYLEAEIAPVYGRVPWAILPAQVRAALQKKRSDAVLLELMNEVFEAPPQSLGPPAMRARPAQSTSPSQAA